MELEFADGVGRVVGPGEGFAPTDEFLLWIELGVDAVGHHPPAESGTGRKATEAADEKGQTEVSAHGFAGMVTHCR